MDESSGSSPAVPAAAGETAPGDSNRGDWDRGDWDRADGDRGEPGPGWIASRPLLPARHHPAWHRQAAGGGEEAVLGLIATLFGLGLVELLLSLGWISS